MTTQVFAGRFDFEDGGTYCGGWEDGKAHGLGVCTGPKSMGEFSGVWQYGYEVSGVYIWPSGNCYLGQWMSGKRHGLGVEKKQRWIYKGEWSQGFKGRYGVRISETSGARYEGTWANGLQDGYGSESYADGGIYWGQMSQGMRNGYGIRKSVAYGCASRYRSKDVRDSLTSLRSEEEDERVQRERDRKFDENRGGFVLRARSDPVDELGATTANRGIVSTALSGLLKRRRNSLGQSQERRSSLRKKIISKLTKQKSVNDIDDVNQNRGASTGRGNKKSSFRSTSSNNSVDSRTSNRTAPPIVGNGGIAGGGLNSPATNTLDDDAHSFISQDEITDTNCIEVYMGEWKQDKRTGFGIAERSDGLKYEGEWFNNKKNGYGVTTFKDGTKEEGKYKNNVLVTDKKKGKLKLLRSSKHREKIEAGVNSALRAAQIAQQRADLALARAMNARGKAHAAELAAKQARTDSEYARIRSREVAPDFVQPGESKKIPEVFLEIDNNPNSVLSENNISPTPFRRPPLNVQLKPEPPYMNSNWQPHANNYSPSQQHYSAPTPPPTQNQSTLLNKPLNPQQQYYSDINRHQEYITPNPNLLPSNQLMHNPDIQKPMNEMIGVHQLDQQTASQMHMHPSYIQPPYTNGGGLVTTSNNYMYKTPQQQHQYSFDKPVNMSFDDATIGIVDPNRMLQNQQYPNNIDLYNNQYQYNQNSFDDPTNPNFQRSNPKRNTLKRSQRVIENSQEDLSGQKAHYSNNSGQDGNINNNNNNAQINNTNQIRNTNEHITSEPEFEFLKPATQLPRRKSLPSIVKNQSFKEDETAHSSSDLNSRNQETFIIENGIRKRITEKSNPSILFANTNTTGHKNVVSSTSNDYNEDRSPHLPRKIIIESITSLHQTESKLGAKRVSMPTINALLSPKFANKVMSREEANRLSSLRREHIRKYGNENENSSFIKLKSVFGDCFNRHRLFLAIIIFNISLAIWFFQLLK